MSQFSFLDPASSFALPGNFNFEDYIDTEREMWALFPETQGKRVNFCQLGLTAQIFIESAERNELASDETYFLMPCPDRTLRPIRMKAVRRLTLDEFRLSHITAIRLAEKLDGTRKVMEAVHLQILGPEILGV
ncbi:MAG TPA: hypothetical protein VME43_30350 [Bryobacteraceae bacterium]|nr:hypothetical protein [Bryobacteraceae bacterium]